MFLAKFKEIITETENAILLKDWANVDVWLPKNCIKPYYKYEKGVAYLIPEWLVKEKKIQAKEFNAYHKPKKINPEYNQEALDELKY